MLLEAFVELSMTPPEERKDEKRYRLKLPFGVESYNYLNIVKESGDYVLSTKEETDRFRSTFAESEIEQLEAKHNLDNFISEEVEEDDAR